MANNLELFFSAMTHRGCDRYGRMTEYKRAGGEFTLAASNLASAKYTGRRQMKSRTILSIAVAAAMLLPVGVVSLVSAQDRDRDQLKTDQLLQDKDKLQTKDRLKDKDQLKEQEQTRERTREQIRTERPERPQHEKAERAERGGAGGGGR